jgi:hypothetical protein
MTRPYRNILISSFLALSAAVLPYGVAGCGSKAEETCLGTVAPPGQSFTFHVHNGGSKTLRLTYGCGDELPIQLDTPAGSLGIGSTDCTWTCESIYDGSAAMSGPFSCTDCGPGQGAALDPGATVDITWDRRVYAATNVDPSCGGGAGAQCMLATAVVPAVAQKGVLTVCAEAAIEGGFQGACGSAADEQAHGFTIDTTGDEGTIEVQ